MWTPEYKKEQNEIEKLVELIDISDFVNPKQEIEEENEPDYQKYIQMHGRSGKNDNL